MIYFFIFFSILVYCLIIIDFATAAQLFENNTASVQFIDEFNQIAPRCHFPKAVKDDKAAQLFEKHTDRHTLLSKTVLISPCVKFLVKIVY